MDSGNQGLHIWLCHLNSMNIWMLTQGPIHIYWNIKALQHLSIQNPPGTCLEGYAFACREGNGTPLQYFCLEDPMDGGAWRAAVHGVAKSQAWLSNFTFTFHFHSLEKEMATHSSTLAWKPQWMEEPGRLQFMGSLRVGHNWVTSLSLFTFMHWRKKWQLTPVFWPGESQGWGSLVGCRLWGRTELDKTAAT